MKLQLFKLRGTKTPPSEVIVVSIDEASSDKLSLPDNPRKWPRSHHARLIDTLSGKGARVVVFDMYFEEERSGTEDNLLVTAINNARNVVISERLKSAGENEGKPADNLPTVTINGDRTIIMNNLNKAFGMDPLSARVMPIPTIPLIEQSTAGIAPFPLPKKPVKVSQFWTFFKTRAGDKPTLPVMAFHIYALDVYDDFLQLLEKNHPGGAVKLPRDSDTAASAGSIGSQINGLRDIFEKNPQTAEGMFRELQDPASLPGEPEKKRKIRSLIHMLQLPNSRYLNFYGYPRTVTTIPYHQILNIDDTDNGSQGIDLKGKAVFIGLSEIHHPEQNDSFYTVFSHPDGLDISGVEIAATAFANILEDMPVQPVGFNVHLAAVLLWGVAVGIICRLSPAILAALASMGSGVIYLFVAEYKDPSPKGTVLG